MSYSGDNEPALWAVESGHFATLQTSLNLTDQGGRTSGLLAAAARGIGVVIKRPIGGGTWARARRNEPTPRQYDDEYLHRATEMWGGEDLPDEPQDSIAMALGFTLAHAEVHVAIVGTKSPEHMRSNLDLIEQRVPVPESTIAELRAR